MFFSDFILYEDEYFLVDILEFGTINSINKYKTKIIFYNDGAIN